MLKDKSLVEFLVLAAIFIALRVALIAFSAWVALILYNSFAPGLWSVREATYNGMIQLLVFYGVLYGTWASSTSKD
jgi:hypothetical protein